ncbi:MAG: 6-phospho-beta-glucosidase [Brevinema sp.]
MKKGLKIATIGGGSSYTPEFAEGLITRAKQMPVSEWWLVDIEEGKEKMEIVGHLAQRMFQKAGLDTKVHMTLNRKEALKDADFVTTQFRVGLLDARAKDERIPLKYNCIGQETNGAGGLFKALRTIPVILDICKDMKELCPDAWLINFTNPAGMITQAAINYGKQEKTIGLCNVPIVMSQGIAESLNKNAKDIEVQMAGMNHFVWALHAYIDGKDHLNDSLEYLIENVNKAPANFAYQKWEPSVIKAMGVLPCPYHLYYFSTEEMLKEELNDAKNKGTRAEVVKKVEEELFELYKDPELKEKPKQLEQRGGAYYSDAACGVIEAIYTDSNAHIVANTINNSTIRSLPANAAVESTCIVNKSGAHPLAVKELPQWMDQWLQLVFAYQDLTIKAAVEGDYNALLQAFYINPLTPKGKKAEELIKELMLAHEKYLPQFKKLITSYK